MTLAANYVAQPRVLEAQVLVDNEGGDTGNMGHAKPYHRCRHQSVRRSDGCAEHSATVGEGQQACINSEYSAAVDPVDAVATRPRARSTL